MPNYSKDDIERVADAMKKAKELGSSFSLLTGAGCSKSAGIPLANDLITQIRKTYPIVIKDLTEDKKNDYGAHMSCLSMAQRSHLIDSHLREAKVNWAHIAMASLMKTGFVSRVLTFNFDQLLAQACALLGLYPATYDLAASDIDRHNVASPAIIHLHGQCYGSMKNTSKETEKQKKRLRTVFDLAFGTHPTLVIGYSGKADEAFSVITQQYSGRHQIFWAAFENTNDSRLEDLVAKGGTSAKVFYGADADCFLCDLARQLGCFPPSLFENPYRHLLEMLQKIGEFRNYGNITTDIMADLCERLELDDSKLCSQRRGRSLITLLMEGKLDELIAATDDAIPEDASLRITALNAKGIEATNQADQKDESDPHKHLSRAFDYFSKATMLASTNCDVLNNWGNALVSLARRCKFPEAEQHFQSAYDKYSKAIEINPAITGVLYNWGTALVAHAQRLYQAQKNPRACDFFRDAGTKFDRVVQIDPTLWMAYHNWGGSHYLSRQDLQKPNLLKIFCALQ